MTKESKTVNPRKEVQQKRREAFKEAAAPIVFKLVAGVTIVAASFSSIYKVLLEAIKSNPEYFAAGIAALAIVALVVVLAHFDSKK